MKILVDADACPVKEIITRVAKEKKLEVLMFIDTCHLYDDGYSKVFVVDKGKDSADMALVNRAEKGDIVVTQDYGLASMVLAKNAYALSPNGLIYDKNNIDRLMFERYLSAKVRRSGGRWGNPKKRTKESDERFEASLRALCNRHNQSYQAMPE